MGLVAGVGPFRCQASVTPRFRRFSWRGRPGVGRIALPSDRGAPGLPGLLLLFRGPPPFCRASWSLVARGRLGPPPLSGPSPLGLLGPVLPSGVWGPMFGSPLPGFPACLSCPTHRVVLHQTRASGLSAPSRRDCGRALGRRLRSRRPLCTLERSGGGLARARAAFLTQLLSRVAATALRSRRAARLRSRRKQLLGRLRLRTCPRLIGRDFGRDLSAPGSRVFGRAAWPRLRSRRTQGPQ